MNGTEGQGLDRQRAGVHAGEIAILCGTRGRPDMFAESLASLRATVRDRARTHLWVYVDEDDAVTRRAIEGGTIPDPGLPARAVPSAQRRARVVPWPAAAASRKDAVVEAVAAGGGGGGQNASIKGRQ
jgi:hypothetical protein